jgi:endonuclease/exonuclease/phosphatase family metal-dependent hydrolase
MRAVHFILIAFSLLLGGFLTGGYFIGEDMLFVGWLFEFPMLFFAAASFLLVLIFAATGLRLWIALPLAEIALCVVLLQPGLSSFKPVPKEEKTLVVMSYNVQKFRLGTENVMEVVRNADPDILFIQEYRDSDKTPDSFRDELFPEGDFVLTFQNAVFSKHPLRDEEWVEVDGNRSIQKITAEVGDTEVTICNVHFPVVVPLTRYHMEQYGILGNALDKQRIGREKLLKIVDDRTRPTIIAGDFNAAPHTMLVRMLQKKAQDSFLVCGAGLGNTFDSKLPIVRIDYVFVSDEFTVYSHEVLDKKASDHRPVVVRVSLDESE